MRLWVQSWAAQNKTRQKEGVDAEQAGSSCALDMAGRLSSKVTQLENKHCFLQNNYRACSPTDRAITLAPLKNKNKTQRIFCLTKTVSPTGPGRRSAVHMRSTVKPMWGQGHLTVQVNLCLFSELAHGKHEARVKD